MEEFLWVEKYRPTTIKETILPAHYKEMFTSYVEQGNIPNLIISGAAGVGKTTIARAMCEELGAPMLFINGSLDGSKDTLRNDITDFASSMSMSGGRKYVILDEADGLTHHVQPAMRAFMEEYSANCGFILTCNLPHKIIDPLHSRCAIINITFTQTERKDMLMQIMKRLMFILKDNDVTFDKKVVLQFIIKHYPDIRKMINDLQKYAANGNIDAGLLTDFDDITLQQLLKAMRTKNFDAMRDWITQSPVDQHVVYEKLYTLAYKLFTPPSAAHLVVLLAEYQYKAAFAVNPDINLAAALLEISSTLDWKD